MKPAQKTPRCSYELSDVPGRGLKIELRGMIDAAGAAALLATLLPDIRSRSFSSLTVSLAELAHVDDFGGLVLLELKKAALQNGAALYAEQAPEALGNLLEQFRFDEPPSTQPRRAADIMTRLGAATLELFTDLNYMLSFIGAICLALLQVVRHPRCLRSDDTFVSMQKTGVDALPIVGLISFLLGLIMAFMSAVQLRQFGANIYVASLVSLAMTRELGPIMTAIIVAGRSGSAFAAEIGTMKISDEVDALTTMGFDPVRFLVVPKLVAAVIVVPLLVLFSDLFAIVGGLIVGVGMLDLTSNSYIDQTIKTLELFDVFWGVFKGGVFALLIAWIGCFRGFQVRGGAASVGQATTSAVVSSIFLIILTDSVFAVILTYWG